MLPDLRINTPDAALSAAVRHAIDTKTKPVGSLGRIEELAHQMALAQGRALPSAEAALLLFAGDHGMVAEGVSAWPSDVTAQMVLNFLDGGAAANVFARVAGARVIVADAGVAGDLPDHPALRRLGLAKGTRNAAVEDAMTADQVTAALEFGAALARMAIEDGARVIALGEMGIGNTSSAALLTHAVSAVDLDVLTGAGAGLAPEGVARKRATLARIAARRPGPLEPRVALAAFGGFEIAAMAGALIGAASRDAVILVDGFIATAAALMALTARPDACGHVIFAHLSHEKGHRAMLEAVPGSPVPLLTLDLRLGEGSGALLALPLLQAAAAMLADMATFESAGVSGRLT